MNTASCTSADHLHRRRRRHPALPRLPDRAAGRAARRSSRSSYLLIYGELPDAPTELDRLRAAHPRSTRCCTRTSGASSTASRATPTRCRCCPAPCQRAVDLLPGQPRPVRQRAGRDLDDPAAGEAADHRRLRLQEVASASRSCTRTTRSSLVENFLRMTFGCAGGALRGRPRGHAGAGPAADPARRPRAELLDVDRAPGRARRTPTCSRRSPPASTRCSVRCTAAPTRRCSRCSSSIRDSGGARRHVRPPGQEPRGRREADGLRPPRLQELRPARRDRQETAARGLRALCTCTTRCSTSPSGSRRSR